MRKVYVMCPAYMSTGGTELLHQLVYKLIHIFKIDAYIYYPNVEWRYEFNPTPIKFIKYIKNSWVESLEDSSDYILIVPETMSKMVDNYNKAELWIWWLSIDNFFITIGKSYTYKKFAKPNLSWWFRKLFNLKPYKNLNNILNKKNIKLHLYQSEYAKLFLNKSKVHQQVYPLSDYIDTCFVSAILDKSKERLNQVLYNPIKGFEITKELIKASPEIKWVPIIKMKPEEIAELMAYSKVYVDFGNHPGKDRIPREAALNGCCIIVNKEGAAYNNLDIDIFEEFKINDPLKEQKQVIALIKKIFESYNNEYIKFENYVDKIKKEEKTFESEIEQLVKFIQP